MEVETTLQIQSEDLDTRTLERVRRVLEAHGVVCLPTDTVYGLGVNPRSRQAVDRLFEVKGRDSTKAIPLLVDSIQMAYSVAVPTSRFEEIAATFWPGPLTLVLHAQEHVMDRLTAGRGTIGLRWPDAAVPVELIHAFGAPITGTSANRSGYPVAHTAEEVLEQLGDTIDVVINGGALAASPTSTVLDLTGELPFLVREGAIRYGALAEFLDGRIERRSA